MKASGVMVCVVPVHYVPGALSSIHVHTFELWRVIKTFYTFGQQQVQKHILVVYSMHVKYARCIQDKENFLPRWSN